MAKSLKFVDIFAVCHILLYSNCSESDLNLDLFEICAALILFVIQRLILYLVSKCQMSSGPHGPILFCYGEHSTCPLHLKFSSGNFFCRKSTMGTAIVAIDANNDTYYLQKQIEKFPLIDIPTQSVQYCAGNLRLRMQFSITHLQIYNSTYRIFKYSSIF